jgi:hypothetical protein
MKRVLRLTVLELKSVVVSRYSYRITYHVKRAQMGPQHKVLRKICYIVTICKPKLPVTVDTPIVTVCAVALNNSAFPLTFYVIMLTEGNQLLFPYRASTDCCYRVVVFTVLQNLNLCIV